jgi:hypothetical protein
MRFVAAILFVCTLFAASAAHADINQIQAREVARNNNCTPTKVDVYQQSLGSEGNTIYKIDCNIPKMADANAPKPASSLLVTCRDNMCQLLRPLAGETK